MGQGGQRGEQRRAVEGYRRELGVAQRGLLLLRFAEFRRVQRPRGVVGGQEASRHGLIAPVARVVGLAQAVLVQRHQPNEHANAGDYPRNDESREVHPEDVRTRRVSRAGGPGRPEGDELLHGVPPGAVREGPDPGPAAAVRGARRPDETRHRGFVSKRRGRAASTARASLPRVAARAMGCAKVDDALIKLLIFLPRQHVRFFSSYGNAVRKNLCANQSHRQPASDTAANPRSRLRFRLIPPQFAPLRATTHRAASIEPRKSERYEEARGNRAEVSHGGSFGSPRGL